MADVSKTAAVNASLQSVKNITKVAGKAQTALATGRSVNKVTDSPTSFFLAKALTDRAGDLAQRKDTVDQSISSLKVANTAIEAVDKFAKQLKGLAEASKTASPAEQRALSKQFEEIGKQIGNLVEDASFQGQNLVAGSNTLSVQFDRREDSKLDIQGLDLNGTAVDTENGLFSVAAFQSDGSFAASAFGLASGSFTAVGSDPSLADDVIQAVDQGIDRLRAQASRIGSNVAILQERANFTDAQVNELNAGADKLTLADLNEEAANSVAAQTGLQLGINSIGIAGDQQRAILDVLGS